VTYFVIRHRSPGCHLQQTHPKRIDIYHYRKRERKTERERKRKREKEKERERKKKKEIISHIEKEIKISKPDLVEYPLRFLFIKISGARKQKLFFLFGVNTEFIVEKEYVKLLLFTWGGRMEERGRGGEGSERLEV
jgi:hypothetical protein